MPDAAATPLRVVPYALPTAADLPANTAQWAPDPTRAALLIHDMQEYFLRPFPVDHPMRSRLLRNIAVLREWCARAGMPVAYTAQCGAMTPEQRGLLRDFWGPGMRAAPDDREIVATLAARPGDWHITKWRYSAFHRSDLLDRLRSAGRDQLLICGVYAHVGVLMTACDGFAHDVQTFVVADAVADFTFEEHMMALAYAARRCAVVDTTARILDRLDRARVPA